MTGRPSIVIPSIVIVTAPRAAITLTAISLIRQVLRDPGHARAFNIVMAVLLVMAMIPAVLPEVLA